MYINVVAPERLRLDIWVVKGVWTLYIVHGILLIPLVLENNFSVAKWGDEASITKMPLDWVRFIIDVISPDIPSMEY